MAFLLFQAFHFFLSLSLSHSISVFPCSVQLSVWSSVFYIFWLVVWLFGRLLLNEMHEKRNTAKFIAHPLAAPLPLLSSDNGSYSFWIWICWRISISSRCNFNCFVAKICCILSSAGTNYTQFMAFNFVQKICRICCSLMAKKINTPKWLVVWHFVFFSHFSHFVFLVDRTAFC